MKGSLARFLVSVVCSLVFLKLAASYLFLFKLDKESAEFLRPEFFRSTGFGLLTSLVGISEGLDDLSGLVCLAV